jgi:hypothetical protein
MGQLKPNYDLVFLLFPWHDKVISI